MLCIRLKRGSGKSDAMRALPLLKMLDKGFSNCAACATYDNKTAVHRSTPFLK